MLDSHLVTNGRQLKRSNQLSRPRQDDCNTSKETK